MSEDTLFERRRPPTAWRHWMVGSGVATLGAVAVAVATASPGSTLHAIPTGMIALVGGVITMVLGLAATERGAYGGRLRRLRRRLGLAQPAGDAGYRESPRGPDLIVDGEAVPAERAREVVLGRIAHHGGGGNVIESWPLYLVFDDRVVELDVFSDRDDALAARSELAERLHLPTRSLETGVLGSGVLSGCLVGVLTIVAQLAALTAGTFLTLLAEGAALQLLLPALMVLVLWGFSEGATHAGAKRVRPTIDDDVRRTFDLQGPRVRVADPEPDIALEELDVPVEREAPMDAERRD